MKTLRVNMTPGKPPPRSEPPRREPVGFDPDTGRWRYAGRGPMPTDELEQYESDCRADNRITWEAEGRVPS